MHDKNVIHLHNHTEYSLLDGASRIPGNNRYVTRGEKTPGQIAMEATQHDATNDDSTDSLDLCLCCDHDGFDPGFNAGWEDGKEFGLIKGAFEAGKIARYDEDRAADIEAEKGAPDDADEIENDLHRAIFNLLDSGEWTDTDYEYAAHLGVTDSACGWEWYQYDLKRNPEMRSGDPDLEAARHFQAEAKAARRQADAAE
jgi:hypothetical protein